MADILDSDNKIVMVCRAQIYYDYDTAAELNPQIQLIFVCTSFSSVIPISTAPERVQEIYSHTPAGNCWSFCWDGTIGKAIYQNQTWISYNSVFGNVHHLHILETVYRGFFSHPSISANKELKTDQAESKNIESKTLLINKKEGESQSEAAKRILLTPEDQPLLVCLAEIQENKISSVLNKKQFAFIVVSKTSEVIKKQRVCSLNNEILIGYERASYHYNWSQNSNYGRQVFNYKHPIRISKANQTLFLIKVYYDCRGPIDQLWRSEAITTTEQSIKHHVPKIKLYRQPLTNNKSSCPFCSKPLTYTTVTVVFYQNSVRRTKDKQYKYCSACNMPYLSVCDKEQILADCVPFVQTFMVKDCKNLQEAKQMAYSRGFIYQRKSTKPVQPYTPIPFIANTNLSLQSAKTGKIYIFAEKCYCRSCVEKYGLNTIESQTARVSTISGKIIPVNVQYCNCCGCYYMNVRTYKDYCKRYGHLLLEINYTEEFDTGFYDGFEGFAKDSILSRCGYSVKQGIPVTTRQKILIYIMESKRATKWQIIDLISGFISLNSSLPRMSGAVDRWSEDLIFVNDYKLGSQPLTSVDTFAQGGSISERYRSI